MVIRAEVGRGMMPAVGEMISASIIAGNRALPQPQMSGDRASLSWAPPLIADNPPAQAS